MATDLDFGVRYKVDGWSGIAFYPVGYVEVPEYWEDGEPTGETVTDFDLVIMVMVGDDREHVVDVADVTPLADEDYCSVCGQIGCTADGRS